MQTRRYNKFICLVLVALLCVGLVVVPQRANAADYYSSISATGGAQLLGQLHDLITSTHKKYTIYDECGNASNLDKVYTSDPGSNSNYLREFYTQQDISLTNFNNDGGWNREHVWPKANSNGIWPSNDSNPKGGGADLHHVRPAEKDLNAKRGNNKYGIVASHNSSTERKYYGTNYVGGWLANGTFEPLDQVKGDVARILFYVYTHYNTYSNSIFGGYAKTNGTGSTSYFGTLSFSMNVAGTEEQAIALLLEWNANDPVDDIERTRNEAVYKIQENRNPFIDHPEYANAIWGDGTVTDPDTPIDPTPSGDKITITRSDLTSATNSYGFNTWTSEGISVIAYINGGQTSCFQFNNSQNYCYLASTSATPRPITSVTVKLSSNSGGNQNPKWTLRTSNAAYGELTERDKSPNIGTSWGEETATEGVVTWTVTGNDTYFTLNYTGSGVCYIASIEVTFAEEEPASTVTLNTDTLSLNVGQTASLTATTNGSGTLTWSSSNTSVAEVNNGTVTAKAAGSVTITASFGNATATCNVTVTAAQPPQTELYVADMSDLRENFAYKLAVNQTTAGNTYYAKNQIANSYYVQTTTTVAQADDVYVEKVDGGFRLCFGSGANKKYINAVVSGTYTNLALTSTADTVWKYDSAKCCIYTSVVVNGTNKNAILCSYETYTTISLRQGTGEFPAYLCSLTQPPHQCNSVCSECEKCTSNCTEKECADKCQGHQQTPAHECGNVCPICKLCLDTECQESACQEKCQGHQQTPAHQCGNVCSECEKCTSNCTETECADKCQGHQQTPAHQCGNVCSECEKCTSNCTKTECAEKCQGHQQTPTHECGNVCSECEKCTSDCTEKECSDKCQGHATEPTGVDLFKQSVQQLSQATDKQSQYTAICNALEIYLSLSQEQQSTVTAEYSTLQSAISAYNANSRQHNEAMQTALQNAVTKVICWSVALAAAIFVLKQRW